MGSRTTITKACHNVLVLPDIHLRPAAAGGVPTGEDTETLEAVLKYVKTTSFDAVVQIGDLMDLDVLSAHNHGKPGLVEGKRLKADYDHANKWLDRWTAATPGAKWALVEGNHEHRAVRYAEAHPEMEGTVDVATNLRLADRGIVWVPYWSQGDVLTVGNATFGHGRHTNQYHSKKHLDEYGTSFYYGHVHDRQSFSRTTFGNDKTLAASSLGCLCRYQQPYMQGRPSRWQQSFSVFRFRENGFFNVYPVDVFDHHFISPEGDVY